MGRKIKKILAVAAVLAVAGVLSAALFAVRKERRAEVVIPATSTLTPEMLAHPGAPAAAAANFRLPWGDAVVEATATPGKGTVISGPVRVDSHWRWGYRRWHVEATVRPLASRGAESGTLRLKFDRAFGSGAAKEVKIAIPAPRVADDDAKRPAEELRLAGAEPPAPGPSFFRRYWWIILALAAALILTALALWRRGARRRAAASEVPPWERALAELERLRRDLGQPGFAPAEGVRKISDILRRYLTRRFGMPADTETTEEFFAVACSDLEVLAAADREFLHEFLAAADLVKFARVPADAAALLPALDRAAELVKRTVPRPEEPTEGAKEAAS